MKRNHSSTADGNGFGYSSNGGSGAQQESPRSPFKSNLRRNSNFKASPSKTKLVEKRISINHLDDFIEIQFPGHTDKIKIKQPSIPIKESGPEKFNELDTIHKQIVGLGVIPDFGYK